jgi:hypothetical protein
MQILSTRSKVNSRRFYKKFTFNKRCKSYVRDKKIEFGSSKELEWERVSKGEALASVFVYFLSLPSFFIHIPPSSLFILPLF